MRPGDGSAERPPLRGQLLPPVSARGGDEPAGAAAAVHRGAVAGTGTPGGDSSAQQPSEPSRWSGRRTRCAGGGADGGSAATALPAAAAARPVGRGAPLYLADAAHQGGSGNRRAYAADRGAALIKLAAPGLVSSSVRAPACPPPARRAPSGWLTRWTTRRRASPRWG